jgi:uncharacterized membrane-anchored protein
MKRVIEKSINLNLVGLNANAFALMGAWRRQAKREDWTEEEIEAVMTEATSSDYNHLLSTLENHCEYEDDEPLNY